MNNYQLQGYITNLGLYNEGELKGAWVTFPLYEDEAQEILESIGIGVENEFGEVYEEYFFTDFEQSDEVLDVSELEYATIDSINETVEAIENLYENDFELLKAVKECEGIDIESFNPDDYVFYQDMTLRDLAEELMHEQYGDDSFLDNYFDFDGYADDLSCEYNEASNGCYECIR